MKGQIFIVQVLVPSIEISIKFGRRVHWSDYEKFYVPAPSYKKAIKILLPELPKEKISKELARAAKAESDGRYYRFFVAKIPSNAKVTQINDLCFIGPGHPLFT